MSETTGHSEPEIERWDYQVRLDRPMPKIWLKINIRRLVESREIERANNERGMMGGY